jgi:outer membrane protein assembly factor BamB
VSIIRRLSPAAALVSSLVLLVGCGGGNDRSAVTRANAVSSDHSAADLKAFKDRVRTTDTVAFEHAWDLQLPGPVHASWISPEINDVLYVQLEGSNAVYAIDAFSGRTRWVSQPLPKGIALNAHSARVVLPSGKVGESINDDRVYLVSDDVLYCIDGVYGEVVWRYELPFSSAAGPHAVGPDGNLRVFLGDWAGRLQVVTWSPKNGLAYQLWQYPLGAPLTAPAVAYENLVYVGDQGGKISCFDLERVMKWKTDVGGKVLGSPDLANRLLYVGTTANVFYCLNRLSGEELARVHLNAPISRSPFHFRADPGLIYAWTDSPDPARGGLWAFESRSDQLELTHNLDAQNRPRKKEIIRLTKRFFVPGVTRLVSSSPEHLFLMGEGSTVVQAVNRSTGTTDWVWDLNDGRSSKEEVTQVTTYADPSDFNRSVFTIGADNRIHAFRLFGGRDVGVTAGK